MNRLPPELQQKYKETQLDRVEIDGVEIQGYFEYSFLEEKSWSEQPSRSSDGTMQGIDDITTFLTPRLIIKYNMMGIDDYRTLMKMLKNKNAFIVTCYDVVEDKRVTHEMYFAPPAMPIIYQQCLMALGIKEYSIELIGTNRKLSPITITYDFSQVQGYLDLTYYSFEKTVTNFDEKVYVGTNIQVFDREVDDFTTLDSSLGRIFSNYSWNTKPNGSGMVYEQGSLAFFGNDTTLYLQVEGI